MHDIVESKFLGYVNQYFVLFFMIGVFTPNGFIVFFPLKQPETSEDFDFDYAVCILTL